MNHSPPPNPDIDPVTFTITLRPLPSAVPVFIRLRRMLKSLLRTYSFECTYYTMTPTLSHATPPTPNGTPEGGKCSSVPTTRIGGAE